MFVSRIKPSGVAVVLGFLAVFSTLALYRAKDGLGIAAAGQLYVPIWSLYLAVGIVAIVAFVIAAQTEVFLQWYTKDTKRTISSLKTSTKESNLRAGRLQNELNEIKRAVDPEFQDMKSQANGAIVCPWCDYEVWFIDHPPTECPKCREIIGEEEN